MSSLRPAIWRYDLYYVCWFILRLFDPYLCFLIWWYIPSMTSRDHWTQEATHGWCHEVSVPLAFVKPVVSECASPFTVEWRYLGEAGLVIAGGGGGRIGIQNPWISWQQIAPEFFAISKADFQTIHNQIRVRLCSFFDASVNSSMYWFGLGPFVRWLCHDALAEERHDHNSLEFNVLFWPRRLFTCSLGKFHSSVPY